MRLFPQCGSFRFNVIDDTYCLEMLDVPAEVQLDINSHFLRKMYCLFVFKEKLIKRWTGLQMTL